MNHQSRFDAGYRMLGACALEGWYGTEVGGRFRTGNMCTPVADSC